MYKMSLRLLIVPEGKEAGCVKHSSNLKELLLSTDNLNTNTISAQLKTHQMCNIPEFLKFQNNNTSLDTIAMVQIHYSEN